MRNRYRKHRLRHGIETAVEVVVILLLLFAIAQMIAMYFPEPIQCRCCKHTDVYKGQP